MVPGNEIVDLSSNSVNPPFLVEMILRGQNSIIFYLSFFTWYDYRVTYLKTVIVIFRAENREIFFTNYKKK